MAAIALASLTPGDTNDDDEVNLDDILNIVVNFGNASVQFDITLDGLIDLDDLLDVVFYYGVSYDG